MLSVIIPFYNEEENVERVIRGIEEAFARAGVEDYELVGVDNGSRDRTGEILAARARENDRVRPVCVPVNRGLGWGVRQGFAAARGEYLAIQCGDGQTDPRDVVSVYQKLLAEQLDICKVRRVTRADGLYRAVVSKVFNGLSIAMFGVKTDDVNALPKVIRREAYDQLRIQSSDWFIDAEMMIKAARIGLRQGEVETHFFEREGGESNVNWRTILEFCKNMVKYRITGFESDRHGAAPSHGSTNGPHVSAAAAKDGGATRTRVDVERPSLDRD